jgi:hypothetical protein
MDWTTSYSYPITRHTVVELKVARPSIDDQGGFAFFKLDTGVEPTPARRTRDRVSSTPSHVLHVRVFV